MVRSGRGSVLGALLGAALLASLAGCRPDTAGLAAIGLVPNDASVLIGINVGALARSQAIRELQADPTRPFAKAYRESIAASGVDFLRDVDTVWIGTPNTRIRGSFTLASGRFERDRIVSAVDAARVKLGKSRSVARPYLGTRVHTFPDEPRGAFAVLGTSTVLLGSPTLVKLGIYALTKRGSAAGAGGRTVEAVLKRESSPQMIWARLLLPAGRQVRPAPAAGMAPPRVAVQSGSGSLTLTAAFNLSLTFKMADGEQAALAARLLEQEIGKLRDNPVLGLLGVREYLDGIRIGAEGTSAQIQVDFTAVQVKKLLALLERRMSAPKKKRVDP